MGGWPFPFGVVATFLMAFGGVLVKADLFLPYRLQFGFWRVGQAMAMPADVF